MKIELTVKKDKKMTYLQELYNLTLKQKDALDEEDVESLQRLINEKQVFIDKINRIDAEIVQLEENYLEEVNDNCKKLMTAIKEVDEANRQKANYYFQALKEKIGNIRRGKKVYNTYNPAFSNSAFFNKVR